MQSRTEIITAPSGPMGVHVVRPDGDGPFLVVVGLGFIEERIITPIRRGFRLL